MKSTQRRSISLLVAGAAVAALIVMPRFGQAQSTPTASPAASPMAADAELMRVGEEIFLNVCIACHRPEGEGIPGIFPAFAGNPFVTLENPDPMIATVLNGRGGMPRFGGVYEDAEIAAIVTYIRGSFGNSASPVTEEEVAAVRASFEQPQVTPTPEGQEPEGETEATPAQ
ncbi:MAG: c-type cytochrome [Thermomicrobiales bacterium]